MKRPYLLLLLFMMILSSCQEDTVELSRQYLLQGNWQQYKVTEQYFDREGKLTNVIQKVTNNPIKISKDLVIWNYHQDAYSLSEQGEKASLHINCQNLPSNNLIEGLTNKHPDWMSWVSEEENTPYQVNGTNKVASKMIRTLEFRRVDVTK